MDRAGLIIFEIIIKRIYPVLEHDKNAHFIRQSHVFQLILKERERHRLSVLFKQLPSDQNITESFNP